MKAHQLIEKVVAREARRAKRPEVFSKNRAAFLWEVYHVEGYEGLFEAATGIRH
jgi:hypothetical protein